MPPEVMLALLPLPRPIGGRSQCHPARVANGHQEAAFGTRDGETSERAARQCRRKLCWRSFRFHVRSEDDPNVILHAWQTVIKKRLSVRETEKLAKELRANAAGSYVGAPSAST